MIHYHFLLLTDPYNLIGGVESWSRMFFPKMKEIIVLSEIKIKVHLYYMEYKENHKENIMICDDSFFVYPIKYTNNRILSKIFKYWRYFFIPFKNLLINKNDKHIFTYIGSSIESFPLVFFKILFRKKSKHIIWARTILNKHVNSLNISLMKKYILLTFEKISVKYADLIIANGIDTKEKYMKLNPNTFFLFNGININKYDCNPLPIVRPEKIIVTLISRLNEAKGVLDFIRSIKFFNQKYPQLKDKFLFEIVGEGELRERVEESERKIKNLEYKGSLDNEFIPQKVCNIHVGLALTYYYKNESGGAGISIHLLELLSAKRIVIVWDSPIYRQVVNEKSAILISEGDIEKLGDTYNFIFNEYEKARELSLNGYEIVKSYSVENQVKKFFDIVNERLLN